MKNIKDIIKELDRLFYGQDFKTASIFLYENIEECRNNADFITELSLQNEAMGLFRKLNDKEQAIKAINRCLYLINKHELQRNLSIADIYIGCATALTAFSNFKNVDEYFACAEDIYQNNLETVHINNATLYNNWALACFTQGDISRARMLYGKAIYILLKLKNKPLELAMSYISLADSFNMEEEKDFDIITGLINKAFDCFNAEGLARDSYYAFVCEKCLPAISRYGFFRMAMELKNRMELIHERDRII